MAVNREWLTFFLEANIPKTAAVQYAKSFTDNRIQMDMLMDLNKEYLRDLGIIILGDIIAILKHAKQVQSTLTNPNPGKKMTLQPQQPEKKRNLPELPPDVDRKTDISKRLGPPRTIYLDKKSEDQKDVFDRLEPRNKIIQLKKSSSAHDRVGPKVQPPEGSKRTVIDSDQGILRKRVKPPISDDSAPSPRRTVIKRPSEKTHEKKVSFDKEQVQEEVVGKTRFVMVAKRPDGSQTRTVLDPNDPRIKKIGISKKLYIPAGTKREASDRPPSTGGKRQKIVAPDEEREPRPITSRLGDRIGDRLGPISDYSSQQPVARKRISGPEKPSIMERLEFSPKKGDQSRIADRLGPRIKYP